MKQLIGQVIELFTQSIRTKTLNKTSQHCVARGGAGLLAELKLKVPE